MVEAYSGTIPLLLQDAAERDADGTWLRSDQGSLSFSGAVAAVSLTAGSLRAANIRKGDLVMLTASNTPGYLLCWLALTSMGAVAVAVQPPSPSAGTARVGGHGAAGAFGAAPRPARGAPAGPD